MVQSLHNGVHPGSQSADEAELLLLGSESSSPPPQPSTPLHPLPFPYGSALPALELHMQLNFPSACSGDGFLIHSGLVPAQNLCSPPVAFQSPADDLKYPIRSTCCVHSCWGAASFGKMTRKKVVHVWCRSTHRRPHWVRTLAKGPHFSVFFLWFVGCVALEPAAPGGQPCVG